MASSGDQFDRLRKVLECSLCLTIYEDPKTLKCDHDYCKFCLEDILTFEKDGSASITCPLRCKERTHLSSNQTLEDLGTSYTIKGMLDTFKEDDVMNNNIPVCQAEENCVRHISVFCCSNTMCEKCYKKHRERSETKDHVPRKLVYHTQKNKLMVLCEEHSTGCSHLCCVDHQFLCLYCLQRDERHRHHLRVAVETEADILRGTLNYELDRTRKIKESKRRAVQRIKDAKESLRSILFQRKMACMMEYGSLLDKETAKLMEKFDKIAEKHFQVYNKLGVDNLDYHESMLNKLEVEIVLHKQEIQAVASSSSAKSWQGVDVSLSESQKNTNPLGDINATIVDVDVDVDMDVPYFNCDWLPKQHLSSSAVEAIRHLSPTIAFPTSGKPSFFISESSKTVEETSEADIPTLANTEAVSCASEPPLLSEACATSSKGECSDIPLAEGAGVQRHNAVDEEAIPKKVSKVGEEGCSSFILASGSRKDHACKSGGEDYSSMCTICCPQEDNQHATFSGPGGDYTVTLHGLSDLGLKLEGNQFFKQKQYEKAAECYSKAIKACSKDNSSQLSVYYQNRAAAYEHLNKWESVVKDCSAALQLNKKYVKALKRRSKAYEKLGQKRKAYEDLVLLSRCNQGSDAEVLESEKRLSESLVEDGLKEIHRKRKTYPLPEPDVVRKYASLFNYDPFTINLPSPPRECDLNYQKIMENMKKEKYGNVLKFCDQEISCHGPHKHRALLLRGFMKHNMGDETSIKDFLEVLKAPKGEKYLLLKVDAHLKIAYHKFYMEGDVPGSLDAISAAIGLDDKNASIYVQDANLKRKMGLQDAALESFTIAASLDPSYAAPRLELTRIAAAHVLKNNKKGKKEAKKLYLDDIKDFPNEPYAWFEYGCFLLSLGNQEEGFRNLDKAISLNPNFTSPYFSKACHLLYSNSNLEGAEEILLKLLKIDKKYQKAYLHLGKIEMKRGRYEAALKYFEKTLCSTSDAELLDSLMFIERTKALAKVSAAGF